MYNPDLFTWNNIKFLVKELIKVGSVKESWFCKKRLESGIAFFILQWGMIHWLLINVSTIVASELFIWASIEGVICGYIINQIQKEKQL